jgi:hypothetical protein
MWAGAPETAVDVVVADALVDDLPWVGFDVVIGNPPFLSPLASDTARSAERAAALRARFGDAVRAYADSAALFLVDACARTRPGGRAVMLQPQSVLGARDAAGARAAITARGEVREVWVPRRAVFAASVDVCAPVIEVNGHGRRAGSGAPWSSHLAAALGVPAVALDSDTTLGSVATVVAGFRDEYYGTAPHVHEDRDLACGRPLVTSGLIEVGRCAWGERPATVARRRWVAPVVDESRLAGRAARWAARTRGPKVLVAMQTKVVEAAVDEAGTWLPGVPVVAALAPAERVWHIAAALCSPPVSAWVAHRTAGTALAAGALKLSGGIVASVPLPIDEAAWDTGARALRSGDLGTFGAAMTAAHGAGDDLLAWWSRRLVP